MALKLIYGDFPLGAAEDAEVKTADYKSFSEPSLLPVGSSSGGIATFEPNNWGLSSDIKTHGNQKIAFWSNSPTIYDGSFVTPPEIIFEFSEQYTSTGLTFRFAPVNNEYCTRITVEWWQNNEIKESGEFFPSSSLWVLEKTVEAFDKIVVKLFSTNLPFRRAKLEALIVGVIREIDGKELLSSQYISEIDLISNTVPVNVLDAEFITEAKTDLIFQKKQPVEAYNDNNLIGVYYVESGERIGERKYSISCQDAIGILDKDKFPGGLWLEDVPAVTILADIVGESFALDIDEALLTSTIRGYMPECTRREALQQVAFALGAVVDTSGTSKIKIFLPPRGNGITISPAETYIGGKISTADTVTEVVVHGYDIKDKRPTEPWHKYIEIDEVQYRYDLIKASAINPNVSAGTLTNKIEYTECYLINSTNAQTRADAILSYYMRRNSYNVSHVVNVEKPSERVNISLPWGGSQNGNIVKMQVAASGITVSNSDILID